MDDATNIIVSPPQNLHVGIVIEPTIPITPNAVTGKDNMSRPTLGTNPTAVVVNFDQRILSLAKFTNSQTVRSFPAEINLHIPVNEIGGPYNHADYDQKQNEGRH
jgi:hypothetical protein